MARFFVSEKSVEGDIIRVTGPDVKHITKVLRMGPGEDISVVTDTGREMDAKIEEISSKEVICRITVEKESSAEPPVRITLYQGLPKSDKMEFIIQKGTELGISKFVPVICERTIVKLDGKKALDRQGRWQKIAEEAAKQSRRNSIPTVDLPIEFEKAIQNLCGETVAVMPWEQMSGLGLRGVLKQTDIHDVSIFIGPEGGFSDKEASIAETNGVKPITLGPRILRTETAGIVAAAIVLYEIGDMGGTDIG